MVKTVLAVLVAVALVVGAVVVRSDVLGGRSLLDGGGGGGDVVLPDGSEPAEVAEGEVRVACDAALGEGCPEGATRLDLAALLAAFQAPAVAYDVVVAPSVIIEYIEQSQTSRTRFVEEREVLARTPVVLAALGRAASGLDGCGPPVTWACAADLLAAGDMRPGFEDPDDSSEGLVALAALTGGALETTAYSLATLSGEGFLNLVDDLDAADPVGADPPLLRLIVRGGAVNDAALVLEADAQQTLAASQRTPPSLHWPTPLASLAVVAVAVEGRDADVGPVAEAGAEALMAAGWRGPDGAPVEDGPPLDVEDDGLPSGGVLFALQQRWN